MAKQLYTGRRENWEVSSSACEAENDDRYKAFFSLDKWQVNWAQELNRQEDLVHCLEACEVRPSASQESWKAIYDPHDVRNECDLGVVSVQELIRYLLVIRKDEHRVARGQQIWEKQNPKLVMTKACC